MQTQVVNLRTDGYDVYIGRAGHGQAGTFGNPFSKGTRDENIAAFAGWFHSEDSAASAMREAARQVRIGSKLGCFCAPRACHGDVLAAYIDRHGTR